MRELIKDLFIWVVLLLLGASAGSALGIAFTMWAQEQGFLPSGTPTKDEIEAVD